TWTQQTSGTARGLNGVRFADANTGVAVGIDGTILRTTDGGVTWVRQDSGTTADLYAVHLMNTNTVVVAGEGGAILKTTTGGE
ncbi:MAG: YCF48-related protein, partial [Candidatus Krumholzibacteriia bacterium]